MTIPRIIYAGLAIMRHISLPSPRGVLGAVIFTAAGASAAALIYAARAPPSPLLPPSTPRDRGVSRRRRRQDEDADAEDIAASAVPRTAAALSACKTPGDVVRQSSLRRLLSQLVATPSAFHFFSLRLWLSLGRAALAGLHYSLTCAVYHQAGGRRVAALQSAHAQHLPALMWYIARAFTPHAFFDYGISLDANHRWTHRLQASFTGAASAATVASSAVRTQTTPLSAPATLDVRVRFCTEVHEGWDDLLSAAAAERAGAAAAAAEEANAKQREAAAATTTAATRTRHSRIASGMTWKCDLCGERADMTEIECPYCGNARPAKLPLAGDVEMQEDGTEGFLDDETDRGKNKQEDETIAETTSVGNGGIAEGYDPSGWTVVSVDLQCPDNSSKMDVGKLFGALTTLFAALDTLSQGSISHFQGTVTDDDSSPGLDVRFAIRVDLLASVSQRLRARAGLDISSAAIHAVESNVQLAENPAAWWSVAGLDVETILSVAVQTPSVLVGLRPVLVGLGALCGGSVAAEVLARRASWPWGRRLLQAVRVLFTELEDWCMDRERTRPIIKLLRAQATLIGGLVQRVRAMELASATAVFHAQVN